MNEKDNPITVYTLQKTLCFETSITAEELQETLEGLLLDVCSELYAEGCRLIGHIKGMIDAGDGNFFKFSITRFQEPVQWSGSWSGGSETASFVLNVIVFDVKKSIIEKSVSSGLKNISADRKLKVG